MTFMEEVRPRRGGQQRKCNVGGAGECTDRGVPLLPAAKAPPRSSRRLAPFWGHAEVKRGERTQENMGEWTALWGVMVQNHHGIICLFI